MLVALEGDLLALGQQRLDATEVEQGVAVVVLLDRTGDDVTFTVSELFVHLATLNVTNELHQDLLGRLGGNTTEVVRRGVPLASHVAVEVELEAPHLDFARFGVDLDFGVLG